MSAFVDLTGQKFCRLIVIQRMNINKWGNYCWLCECDCGQKKIISGGNLKSGAIKSCGCLQIEKVTKHSHYENNKQSKTYTAWASMLKRCTNPNHRFYHNYGGRGITVCKKWRKFENFLEDMGEVLEGYQIDRIDNNKGYCKSNCRWVTSKINNRNRRNNHLETFNGKTQCVAAWAEEFDVNGDALLARLNYGWSIEKTLTTPIKK